MLQTVSIVERTVDHRRGWPRAILLIVRHNGDWHPQRPLSEHNIHKNGWQVDECSRIYYKRHQPGRRSYHAYALARALAELAANGINTVEYHGTAGGWAEDLAAKVGIRLIRV